MRKFRLSARGLQQTVVCAKDKNFTFNVSGHEYHCHSFFADFISPKIAEMHLTDPLADTFYINLNDDNYEFTNIMNLMEGKSITNAQPTYITKVAKILRNQELFDAYSVKLDYDVEEPDFQGIIAVIDEKHDYGLDYSQEVNFLAQNLHLVPHRLLCGLPLPVMEKIMTSKSLLIDSEEELFNIICELIHHGGPEFSHLFSNVVFENLNSLTMNTFLEKFNPLEIDASIWNVLKNRLVLEVNCPIDYSRYKKIITTLVHNQEQPFTGIFDFLGKKKMVPVKNLVSATLSNDHSISDKIFNKDNNATWHIDEKNDSFLMFDFKSSKVSISGYEIKSGAPESHWDSPHNWVIETSDDKTTWQVVDKRESNTDLISNDTIFYWGIEEKTDPARYIRWRITKDTTQKSSQLQCKQFEIYGDYIEILSQTETST